MQSQEFRREINVWFLSILMSSFEEGKYESFFSWFLNRDIDEISFLICKSSWHTKSGVCKKKYHNYFFHPYTSVWRKANMNYIFFQENSFKGVNSLNSALETL